MNTQIGIVNVNQINIHYERTGGGNPPLLLCHGITDNGRCMLRLAAHLSDRYDAIMVDARGHGNSSAPETGYTAAAHADDLRGLIQALGLENPILYGHSMGARTVARLAAGYPELPKAVIMEDPVYIIPPTEQEFADRDVWLAEMPKVVQQWKTMKRDELVKMADDDPHPDWEAEEILEWAIAKEQVHPNVFDVGISMEQIYNDLPKVSCPTLILKADADDVIKSQNENSIARMLNGKIVHVPEAGHNVRRDNWNATITNLDKFLEAL